MASVTDISADVAIVGFGLSEISRRSDRPLGALALEAARNAIEDSGLTVADIDGYTTGSLLPSVGGNDAIDGVTVVSANWISERLGGEPGWVCGFQGGGQLPGSVIMAANAIASGAANYVLMHRALHNPAGRYHANPMREASGAAQWTAPYGFWGPPAAIALPYQEYIQRYGATRGAMAKLVAQIRRNATDVPYAYWRGKPITEQDYLDARMISDPISILDCDIPIDGAAAFILTSQERARDLPHRPVYLAGHAQGLPRRHDEWATLDDMMEFGFELSGRLWQTCGFGPEAVDVPQVYDGFSPLIYFWLEALGFCPFGEAHSFVQSERIDPAGPFPLLSGGGSLGCGRLHGVPQFLECYLQLAKRAGARQLARSSVGLACHSFPNIGGALVFTDEPNSN